MAPTATPTHPPPRRPPKSVWTTTVPATAAAIVGAVALAGAYLRDVQKPLSSLVPAWASTPVAAAPQTYCYHGIKTMADNQPSARCFTVADGRFTRVFTPENIPGDDTLKDATSLPGYVIPGLWDGHGHLIQYGEFLHSADLFGSKSIDEVRNRLRTYVGKTKDSTVGSASNWLRGLGWDQMALNADGAMPTAAQLAEDPILQDLYIMLDRVDSHCMWVSKSVLELLEQEEPGGIPAHIPGGEIVRDPGLGVFCDNAMDLVVSRWPRPSRTAKTAFIRTAMESLSSQGLVGMHDAGVVPADLQLYKELSLSNDQNWWSIRVNAMIECEERNTFCGDGDDVVAVRTATGRFWAADDGQAVANKEGSSTLLIHSVKLFADGALGSWGSAMLEPYADRPDMSGSLLVNATTLTRLARQWAAAGYQVNIHAIGDRANRYAVDALEAALLDLCPARPPAECQLGLEDFEGGRENGHGEEKEENSAKAAGAVVHGSPGARFRIEHAQIVHPDDQARIHALQIIPSVQPTHATSDSAYAETRLGPQRTRDEAYRMQSFLWGSHDGTVRHHVVLGSDFPIEPPDPFQGIYAAVARKRPGPAGDSDKKPFYPEEALSREDALYGFSRGPAYGAFLEGQAGQITEGAYADWVVLDRDFDAYELEAFRQMRVRETWMGGRRVYKREDDESTV